MCPRSRSRALTWKSVTGVVCTAQPGISKQQRDELIAKLEKATKSAAWQEALKKNDWTPAWLAGDAFARLCDKEFESLQDTMARAGMV